MSLDKNYMSMDLKRLQKKGLLNSILLYLQPKIS
jgi:hypothetical protein